MASDNRSIIIIYSKNGLNREKEKEKVIEQKEKQEDIKY